VRVTGGAVWVAILLAAACAAGARHAAAQDDQQFLMPEQSAAKAKQLLQQAIDALGGSAYLNMRDSTCTGRVGAFDHSGELTGYETFIDYEQPPYKDRQENLPKRNIIQIYNGDKGWVLDRSGVTEAPQSDLEENKENVQKDLYNILRNRIHEPDMIFRYGGPDVIDGWAADWVELVDRDDRTIRIALKQDTHLPVRETVETRDPKTRTKTSEIFYFSNYHPIGGIETPFQVTHERNSMKVFQAFFDKCGYNANLSDSLFTKESLDQRWAQIPNKEKYKDKKGKDRDERDRN
jgi:hypothetical protein